MAALRGCLSGLGAVTMRGCASNILKSFVSVGNRQSAQHPIKNIHCNHGRTKALQAKAEPGEPVNQRPIPEYIPQRKAKNPMKKVALAWAVGFPCGILLFLFAKREVDKKRLKQLKVRQRMKASNEGEYESGRYRKASPVAEVKS